MDKCSPVEMRKNIEVVDTLRLHMIDFVAIPVKSAEHKQELIEQGQRIFSDIIDSDQARVMA